MKVDAFNAASVDDALDALRPAADIDAWLRTIVAARPFATVADVVAVADAASAFWGPSDVDAAVRHHPRIGERAHGVAPEAAMSRAEQSGVDPAAGGVQERLAAGNRAYEERFGRVFLIRAAGRSSDDILEALEQRLGNDDATELAVVVQQLREIAALRLEGILDD